MKLKIILFFLVCLLVIQINSVFAQNEEQLKKAETMCRYVMSQIERREFYLNEFKVNSNRYSIHQPGYFQHFEKYYYAFDKKNPNNPQGILKAVILKTEKNNVTYFKEFVFDNETNVVYYSEKQAENQTHPQSRLQVYFASDKVLKTLQDSENLLDDLKTKKILGMAAKFKQKFMEQVLESQLH